MLCGGATAGGFGGEKRRKQISWELISSAVISEEEKLGP